MPLNRIAAALGLALISGLPLSCSLEPRSNRYEVGGSETRMNPPVTELQQQGLAALDSGDYQLAIDTLQRAIRIQPRNPWNWHYLAQSYWRSGDLERCSAMVERAFSYAADDSRLRQANEKLRRLCSDG